MNPGGYRGADLSAIARNRETTLISTKASDACGSELKAHLGGPSFMRPLMLAPLRKAGWQSHPSQKISQPSKFNGEFGGDYFRDQFALGGSMNLVEMTLAQRPRQ